MAQNTANIVTIKKQIGETEHTRLDFKKLWQALIPKLISLVTFSAVLTCAGFFVIHSYIASFSSLFTYNISVTQYIAAGVNLLLAITYYLVLPSVGYPVCHNG